MQRSRKEKANRYLSLEAKEKIKIEALSHLLGSCTIHAHWQFICLVAGVFQLQPSGQASPIQDSSVVLLHGPSQTHIHHTTNQSFSPLHGLLKYEMLSSKL